MDAPGGLTELGSSAGEWDRRVAEALAALDLPPALAEASPANATELRFPDWPAVPARIRACLGRRRADRLADARLAGDGDVGRPRFQEEYAEWRLVRDAAGRPIRFELTTELSDYWEVLAGYAPAVALERLAGFARTEVPPAALYGDRDQSTPQKRIEAFRAVMLGGSKREEPPGPYNNGVRAMTCLSRRDNTLGALVKLAAAAAAKPQLVIDSDSDEARFPSGSEAIPTLAENSAQDCRNSDPIVVERVVRLATEGRPIRFDDPIGIYILEVQASQLLDPDGEPLPREWFDLSRQGLALPDGLPRHQRLELEVPAGAGFSLAEVRAARTGKPIEHGAQIAELVQLGVYLRVGKRGTVPVAVSPRSAPVVAPCAGRPSCEGERKRAEELEDLLG